MADKAKFRNKRTGEIKTVKWSEVYSFSRNYDYEPTFETWLFLKGRKAWNSHSMKPEDKSAFDAWRLSMLRQATKKAKSFMRLLTRRKSTTKN